MRRTSLMFAGLLLLVVSAPAHAQQPIFAGDPIDPSTGGPYVMLPGVPLVHPGPDERYGTADDSIDTSLVGDVDLVVRTGGAYAGGPIPPPHTSVAGAPSVTVGGAATGTGEQVAVQGIVSDGAPPAAGNALTGPELDGRPLLAVAYADLDGDGFIGPSATDGGTDDEVERQELIVPAGRQTASFVAGVATASLALSIGAPASAGGLGIVVGGGATTGATPYLYFDAPYVATLLPYMPPLDPDRIIGSNGIGGPVPSELLTDFELELDERTFSPTPNHPILGTPYAIPLDGSSPTVDLLRSESGVAVGVAWGRAVEPTTFVASPMRRLVPAVDPTSARVLYEGIDAVALPAGDGGAALDCFVVDRLGNATDPPPGGWAVTLEAGPRLRIVAPDVDGDSQREPITFTTAAAVGVTIVEASPTAGPAVEHVLVARGGVPIGALRVDLGPGGGTGALGTGRTRLRFRKDPARGRLDVATRLDAGSTAFDPATQPVVVTVATGGMVVYARTLAAGSMAANAMGTAFRFHDARPIGPAHVSRLTIRRVRDSTSYTVAMRVRGVDLRTTSPTVPSITLTVSVGAGAFAGDHACSANGATTVTTCVR